MPVKWIKINVPICPYCNYVLYNVEEANYCPRCGKKVEWNG